MRDLTVEQLTVPPTVNGSNAHLTDNQQDLTNKALRSPSQYMDKNHQVMLSTTIA